MKDVNDMKAYRWITLRPLLIAFLLLGLLMGCKAEVYKNLTEEQANAMLSTLLRHGIEVEKIAEGKTGYTLAVEERQLVQALEILKENSLPRERYTNLGEVFSGDGMIASPSEEQARLSYALSQELANTFAHIDGVLTARVHVVLGSTDLATDVHTPASSGVFLRHTPDSPVVNLIPNIREIVAKAIPGLDYERVSVMLVPVREDVTVPTQQAPTFWGLAFSPEAGPPYLVIGASIIVLAALITLIILVISRLQERRARRHKETDNN